MATKLNVDKGGQDIGKKLWKKHQDDEYTHVNNYKEAICLNCFTKDAAAATIAMICGECAGKRGRDSMLLRAGKRAGSSMLLRAGKRGSSMYLRSGK